MIHYTTEQEKLEHDIEFLKRFERGDVLIMHADIHPSWFALAVEQGRTIFMKQFLDAHDVPKDLTLQERIAYYQLMQTER